MSHQFDIAIVGAGMVGAVTACLLAKQGFKIALIDHHLPSSWSEEIFHPRVSAVNLASIKVLEYIDVWESVLEKRASPYRQMQVWDGQTSGEIVFDAHELGQPNLGYILENNAIISTALDRLKQNYLVSIIDNGNVTEVSHHQDHISLSIDNRSESLKCNLVIGADGAHSKVRELSGIKVRQYDQKQSAIVTTVSTEHHHQCTARQCFTNTGPVAMLPLEDGRCSVVWSSEQDHTKHLLSLSEDGFCEQLSTIFENYLGVVQHCTERLSFPIQQQHAEEYLSQRTVLIGDAAHTIHPLAGLGANIGLMDAASLSETVERAHESGKDFGNHSVLRRYERWRKGENALVLSTMQALDGLFSQAASPIRLARQIGVNFTNEIPPIKHQFARYAMGLTGDLPEICRTPEH